MKIERCEHEIVSFWGLFRGSWVKKLDTNNSAISTIWLGICKNKMSGIKTVNRHAYVYNLWNGNFVISYENVKYFVKKYIFIKKNGMCFVTC